MVNEDNLYKYPSLEEYEENKRKVQEDELLSERFIFVSQYSTDNIWGRSNEILEEELFNIIGENRKDIDEITDEESKKMLKKYKILTKFIKSLNDEQIESNIFLRVAKNALSIVLKHATNLCDEFFSKINEVKENESIYLEGKYELPKELIEYIPCKVDERVGIKFYRPQDYRISYINCLSNEYQYIYEDYNMHSDMISQLIENIYLLTINMIIKLSFTGIDVLSVKLIRDSKTQKAKSIEISYYIDKLRKPKIDKTSLDEVDKSITNDDNQEDEEPFIPTPEFIEKTITNYEKLVSLGLVDEYHKEKERKRENH